MTGIVIAIAITVFAVVVAVLLAAVLIVLVTKETAGLRDLGSLVLSIGQAVWYARSVQDRSSTDAERTIAPSARQQIVTVVEGEQSGAGEPGQELQ